MDPLGTNVYLLKRYHPSDSSCTFFSESVHISAEKNLCSFSKSEAQHLGKGSNMVRGWRLETVHAVHLQAWVLLGTCVTINIAQAPGWLNQCGNRPPLLFKSLPWL